MRKLQEQRMKENCEKKKKKLKKKIELMGKSRIKKQVQFEEEKK